jgi:LysM repeat protein
MTVNPKNLKRGDILLNEKHHTAIYVGDGNIVHASLNEKGGIYGGQTGDQTGKEICVRSYYDRPWDLVLRYPDPVLADEYTKKAEAIAADDSHGYDQLKRWGPDFDCSSLVCYVVESVGIPVRSAGKSTYTGNMKVGFTKCGFVIVDTNAPVEPVKPPSTSGDKIHIVKKGETLSAISKRYGVSIDEIMNANKFLKNPNKIYMGDRLTIPTKTEPKNIKGEVKTNGGVLNIRAGKGTNYKIIGTLPNGSGITLSNVSGEWFKLADRDGYVCGRYIVF